MTKKMKILRYKNSDIFHISAQNIICGYSLELPCRGDPRAFRGRSFVIISGFQGEVLV